MEIFHEVESHKPGCADSDVGVTTEVAIYLECEEDGGQDETGAIMVGDIVVYSIDIVAQHISNA